VTHRGKPYNLLQYGENYGRRSFIVQVYVKVKSLSDRLNCKKGHLQARVLSLMV